ncbi:MAG: tRNA (guanosine(37)-N1)-methyltransferase TrmD [Patescibacteria group bacterium]|jgi:tRNA (guanine37-N1)-methyltransferase
MKIDVLTLFPNMFSGPFSESVMKRAQAKQLFELNFINIRDFATDTHNTVDDTPYGGGPGMVMKVDIADNALSKFNLPTGKLNNNKRRIILMTPQGQPFTQKKAREFSKLDHLIIICGHFEGYDERIRSLVDEEISVGDYVLTGGEIPAMALIDATARLIPGVVGKEESIEQETFENNLLEYPQYTRPFEYKGKKVPEILTAGDHKKIAKWRLEQSILKTKEKRSDLYKKYLKN